jgi:uncharacterized membrane protein YkvA (DUF1232 family)
VWSRLWRLRRLFTHGRLVVRLLREPSVPLATKSVPALALLYVLSPLDLLPDVLPGIGELDDLAMVLVALRVFTWLCPGPAVRHHEAALTNRQPYGPMPPSSSVIDAEFRRD